MLIVESGVGMVDSESYISVDYANAYFDKRITKDEWGLITDKEKVIIGAMDYIETSYKYKGTKLNPNQALEFPRLINGSVKFPTRLKNAVCELALKNSKGALLEDTERATIREKVGELEVQYSENSSQGVNYRYVFNLIAPYLENSSSYSSSIIRTY